MRLCLPSKILLWNRYFVNWISFLPHLKRMRSAYSAESNRKGYVILTLSVRPNSVAAFLSLHQRKKTDIISKPSFSLQNTVWFEKPRNLVVLKVFTYRYKILHCTHFRVYYLNHKSEIHVIYVAAPQCYKVIFCFEYSSSFS